MAAAVLKSLFDKRERALAGAKFRAWWQGVDFDEEAALRAIEADLANPPGEDADDALFDPPPFDMPARLQALVTIWGEGRLRPGDATAEVLEPARMGIASDGVLAFLGAGLAAPLVNVAGAHPGKIDVFEWREESIAALQHGIRVAKLEDRVTVARVDLDAHIWTPATYDGLLSIDDFAYAGHPPHLAHQLFKCLKPGACAVVESYVGLPSPMLATAFASSFAEPQIRPHGDVLQYFKDIGFALESDDDLTAEFLDLARQGFKRLAEALSGSAGVEPAIARELAWEAEAWRVRLKLLSQRRLERRRFVLRRPAEQNAEPPTPAPAA
ncbi:MAG: hypothetical protein NW206_03460 [Hyphomonadaceae bacterium]|nr:hypothetical protein [Hyphomonadaceae bacterium]